MPHRIDCGFRKTVPMRARPRFAQPVVRCRPAAAPASGSRKKSSAAIDQPGDAHRRSRSCSTATPARDHRADHELAGRSARHAEHLRRADQRRRARGGKVRGGDVGGADEREDAAGALQEAADARQRRVAGARTAAPRRRPAPRRSAPPCAARAVHAPRRRPG